MKTHRRGRLHAFRYAGSGYWQALKREPNLRMQHLLLLLTVIAGMALGIDRLEWLAIVLCASVVTGLELLNSAVEELCNLVEPDIHPQVKIIKDISAASVLAGALGSLVVGFLIFSPRILTIIQNL